jgi:SPP1 gp7 family putative phage head morphogenesis protein
MIQDFETFIRRGGNGAYTVLLREDGRLSDRAARRAAFDGRLDAVARENEAMLLRVLNAPDTPPAVTPRDLADPSGLRAEVLERWDAWIGPAEDEAGRDAAEERLLRAFAGALNEERQRALGIEGYVWRTRGDGKVRDAHAARSGRLFRWDDVPEGGHPGQDHNCRCVAEPVPEDLTRDIVLADFALPFGDLFGIDPADFLRGLRAATGAGAALLASEVLQAWVGAMRGRRVERVGARLGLNLTTVEGRLAATAYAAVQEGIASARYPVLPKNSEAARIGGEAAALYELANPGTILETGPGGDRAKQRTLQRFIEAAGAAHAQGRLRVRDGDFADGWIEVLPELTEDERRLGQLPGLTPARIEAWLESYTAEELGLSHRTGGGVPDDSSGSIISTPIPDVAGPDVVVMDNPHSVEGVSVPENRARHILDGDDGGGGHRSGTGRPGKTEFPATWSDDRILDAVREVAGTGIADRPARRPGELVIVGEVEGVTIEVVVRPTGEVRTAYPVRGTGVVRNPR